MAREIKWSKNWMGKVPSEGPTPYGKCHEKLPLFWIPSLSGGILKLHIKIHHNKTINLAINKMFCRQKLHSSHKWCAISSGKCGPVKKLKKAPIVNLSLGEVTAECKRLVIVCSIKPTGGASSLMSHCIPRGQAPATCGAFSQRIRSGIIFS